MADLIKKKTFQIKTKCNDEFPRVSFAFLALSYF